MTTLPAGLHWLLPQQRRPPNPLVLQAANTNQPEGLVPPDDAELLYTPWTPDSSAPQEPTEAPDNPQQAMAGFWPPGVMDKATPSRGAADVPDPQPRQPANQMPQMPQAGGGKWASWIEQPGAAEFLITLGTQLMAGGDLGTGIANAFNAASDAQVSAQRADAMGIPDERLPAEGSRRRRAGSSTRGSRRDMGRIGLPAWREPRGSSYVSRGSRAAEDRQTQAVTEFIQSNPSAEIWQQQNMPGGLIHAVFGGPQDYGRRSELLQFVQDRRAQAQDGDLQRTPGGSRMPPSGARRDARGTPSGDELIQMFASGDPAMQAEAQAWARRLYGTAGPNAMWGLDDQGRLARVPSSGRGGRPQGRFEAASRAGVQSARLDIQNIRDYIAQQWPGLGYAERSASISSNIGPYAQLVNNMRNAVASYMHARSGAQTSVREFEHYVDTFLPQAGELEYRTQAKLANLELQTMLIGRLSGEQIDDQQIMNTLNSMRKYLGVREFTPEEFRAILPELENNAVRSMPGGGSSLRPSTRPAAGQGQQLPPGAPATPGGASQGEPQWQVDPDGTRWRVR